MTDQPKRTNLWMWAALILCAVAVLQTWRANDARQELANHETYDSVLLKSSQDLYRLSTRMVDTAEMKLKASEDLRQAQARAFTARITDLVTDNKQLRRMHAKVNTSTASTSRLDSIQHSLYGPAPDDSTHTIPLEYSRQLTGDALRLPIVEIMLTNTEQQLDEWKGHYTRMEGSYKVDLETAGQVIRENQETMDGMMDNAEKMQGELNNQDRKFRRQRRKERVIEVAIVVGIVILAL